MLRNTPKKDALKVYESVIMKAEWDAISREWRVRLPLGNLTDKNTLRLHTLVNEQLMNSGDLKPALESDMFPMPKMDKDSLVNIGVPNREFTLFFVSGKLASYRDDKDKFVENYRYLMSRRRKIWSFVKANPTLAGILIVGIPTLIMSAISLVLENYPFSIREYETRPVEYNECLSGPTVLCSTKTEETGKGRP